MNRFPSRRFVKFWSPATVVLICFLNTNCSRQAKVDAQASEAAQAKVEEVQGQNLIELEHPEEFSLATVEQRRAFNDLKVNGVVAPDVSRTVPVLSLTGGRATDIRARLGDEVMKGQILLRINSPDVALAFSDYEKFRADELLARRQLERSQLLFAKGAIAKKDLETAEDAEQKAKVDLETAAERIRILGADLNHPSPIVEVRAPSSGTIIEQNVTDGTGVRSMDNSPNLFTIADLSRVWVLCDVYENNLAQVRLGDLVEVRLTAFPDREFRGRVSNISRVLDPTTRTAKVRLELDNSRHLMRAGMFATATFRSQTEQLRTVVPVTAVMRLHDKDWVFKPEGGPRFRRIEIQAGRVFSDGMQEVRSGLAPGDKVVANALQFSNAAENQ
jgi:cobalt-zinc-cadmium efflux system membrane fusion protein